MSERALAAASYHDALTAGLALAGTRSLADGPTTGELLLEAEYGRRVQPQLSTLYSGAIGAGLLAWMEMTRPEIVRWVLDYYREREAARPLGETFRQYGRRGFDLGGQMGLDELGLPGQFEASDETVLAAVDGAAARLVDTRRGAGRSTVVTTAEELAAEVDRQRDEGVAAADMLPLLSAWVLGRTVIRSSLIAATESVRMNRLGMVWAFVGNGIRGVVHECALDVEQRCSGACPPLCGTEYELHGVFDPMGGIPSAGQIPLHPRCILPGNEAVIPGRLSAATKSFYHGRAIEIVVSDGRSLTVTENHPILTPGGWVAAKLLHQGDYVLSATNSQRVAAAVNPADDHAPTAIEEVFRAFKESRTVSSRRVPVTAEDFHGDGRNLYGDIEVVYADRLLQGGGIAARGQYLGQLPLSGNGVAFSAFLAAGDSLAFGKRDGPATGCIMSGGHLAGAVFGGHLRPLKKFGLGTVSWLDTGRQQTAANGKSRNAQAVGDGLLRLTSKVATNNGGRVQRKSELAPVLENPGLAHEPMDGMVRHALLAREFVNRFTGYIATNEIVGVREFDFAGHVYDLQCDDYELYITNGVITSNCRCWYSPIQDGWLKPALIWTGFALGALGD